LLDSLGAKESEPPLQVFVATHSPVVLRELSGNQITMLRSQPDKHEAKLADTSDEIQSTLRRYPEAFFAVSILVCEGASEVGIIRGIDQFRSERGFTSLGALGISLVNCGGGEPEKMYARASAFTTLGYRTAILRDSDVEPSVAVHKKYENENGGVFAWRKGMCLEDELFHSLPKEGVCSLVEYAVQLHGDSLVSAHIGSLSNGSKDLQSIQNELAANAEISAANRKLLSKAAQTKNSWFKNIRRMEHIGRQIVGPMLEKSDKEFCAVVKRIFTWMGK
jgi:predicted ATP-dependent endonuclease of OLD family